MKGKKTAIVTGASRGIGQALALLLSEMGYRLVLVSRNKSRLQQVASVITQKNRLKKGEEPLVFDLDVVDSKRVNEAVSQIIKKTKRVDVLVNAAGILKVGTTEISGEEFLKMLQINLLGSFHFIQAVAPFMKRQRSGYIFNLASRAGKVATGLHGGYASSKFGLVGLNEALFNEMSEYGIKVTAICPGWVDTEMAKVSYLKKSEKIPVDDIAKTVRFLLELSPNSAVKEVVIECSKAIEMAFVAAKGYASHQKNKK